MELPLRHLVYKEDGLNLKKVLIRWIDYRNLIKIYHYVIVSKI